MFNVILDQIGNNQTPSLVLVNIVMWLFLYLLYKPSVQWPHQVNATSRYTGIIVIVLFCMFSFWGRDWFHSLLSFDLLHYGEALHYEEFYLWLIPLLPNYLVYRFIVWGAAFLLFFITIKRLNIATDLTLFLFSSIWLIYFSYARASLAMALIFYGLSLWAVPINNKKIVSKILAVFVIVLSTSCHKSAVFGIAIFVLVVISKIIENKKVFFSIVLISMPITLYIVKYYLGDFMAMETTGDEGGFDSALHAGQNYLGMDAAENGIGNIINRAFERIPYYAICFFCYKYMKHNHLLDAGVEYFMRMLILLVVFASVFAFDIGATSSTVYTRFLRFCSIPASICFSYILSNDENGIWPKRLMWFSIIGCLYHLLYAWHIAD